MRDALLEGRGEAWRGEGGGRFKGKGGRGKGKGKGKGKGGGGGVYVARLNFHILGRRQWKPNGISLLYL